MPLKICVGPSLDPMTGPWRVVTTGEADAARVRDVAAPASPRPSRAVAVRRVIMA
jgi:hypothetical protein